MLYLYVDSDRDFILLRWKVWFAKRSNLSGGHNKTKFVLSST